MVTITFGYYQIKHNKTGNQWHAPNSLIHSEICAFVQNLKCWKTVDQLQLSYSYTPIIITWTINVVMFAIIANDKKEVSIAFHAVTLEYLRKEVVQCLFSAERKISTFTECYVVLKKKLTFLHPNISSDPRSNTVIPMQKSAQTSEMQSLNQLLVTKIFILPPFIADVIVQLRKVVSSFNQVIGHNCQQKRLSEMLWFYTTIWGKTQCWCVSAARFLLLLLKLVVQSFRGYNKSQCS